jgi:hypothetical protein
VIRLRHHPDDTIESLSERLRAFPPSLLEFMAGVEACSVFVPDPRITPGFCLISIDGGSPE